MSVARRVDPADFDWAAAAGPAAQIRAITAAADAADGVVSLNEAACLHLKHQGLAGATLVLAEGGFALRRGPELDLVVAPDARRAGLGGALAAEILAQADGGLEAWSHADHAAAARLAQRFGFERERELWVMARPLDHTLPPVTDAPGIRLRSYRPEDAVAVLEVNGHAFAQHPEQGELTLADLNARIAEDWFEPAGLIIAVDEQDQVLGFHWTKVHPGTQPYGEVYVVAVHPRAAGRGLGTLLTAAGLAHLRERGLPRVLLYVDGDNAPAVSVYRSSGFELDRVEAQYRRD